MSGNLPISALHAELEALLFTSKYFIEFLQNWREHRVKNVGSKIWF